MSTPLRQSTAVRALPSTLASRAAPTVPPPSQTYEPFVKSVLRHRLLFRIFVFSAVFSWSLVVVETSLRQGVYGSLGLIGLLLNPIMPRTLTLAFVTWLATAVPVVIMRKICLTATPTVATSPSGLFHSALSKRNTIRSFLVYLASSMSFTFVYVMTAYTYESSNGNDPRLSLFVKSKKHPYYLNGRFIFLITSQLFIAALVTFQSIQLDRLVVRWTGALSVNREKEAPSFMLARIVTVLLRSVLLAGIGIVGHAVLFGVSRAIALPVLFKLPFLHRFLRPFTAHFLRGSWSLTLLARHYGLIARAWILAFITVSNWDFTESVFETTVAEPVNVVHSTADPWLTVVSGIKSEDLYFRHFAYAELQQLASEDSSAGVARRTALFTDQKYNPSMWSSLVRDALLTLGQDYQLFLRRGAPPAPAEAPAVAPPKKMDAPTQVPKTPLVRTQVLKPSHSSPLRSALDTVASDGALTTALSSAAEVGASQIPDLFRSVMPAHPPSVIAKAETAVAAIQQGEQQLQTLVATVPSKWKERVQEAAARYTPAVVRAAAADAVEWWRTERIHRVAEVSLPNRKLDGLAVDALCSLVCASLTEDSFGVVQRDVPRIIEALLSFLTAIEEYRAELTARYPPPTPEEAGALSAKEAAAKHEQMMSVFRASDVLSEVEDPLKEGIVRIVRTFGDKLSAFRFPPRTAKKLQGFVDYN
ncbi:hypothetical protein BDW22DRAFT_1400438 [Trametopsis cervina]|nr:hypothetical protein BDW22DRAFT_1400438 [Trametopsis cervina]